MDVLLSYHPVWPYGAHTRVKEEIPMIHTLAKTLGFAVTVGLVMSSLALAAGNLDKTLSEEHFEGTVTRVDSKGGATIKTTEGREYNVQGIGLQVGDKIECGRHRDGRCEKITAKTK